MTSGRPDWYDQVVITGSDVTLPIGIVSSSVTLDVSITSSTTINVAIQSSAVTLDVNIASSAVTIDVNIKSSAVTLDVAITSSSVTLDVNIAASAVTLNVSVTGTANVNIASASVFLNVKQDIHEYGWNYVGSAATTDTLVAYNYYYFILVNGARGYYYTIKFALKNADTANAKSMTVNIYAQPKTAPIVTHTLTIDAGFDGVYTWYPNMHWNYDKMYIEFVNPDTSNISFYQDTTETEQYTTVAATQWVFSIVKGIQIQVQIRVSEKGVLPVAGTVNTINIPNKTSSAMVGGTYISAGTTVSLLTINDIGKTLYILLQANWASMEWLIYVDGTLLEFESTTRTFKVDDLHHWYNDSQPVTGVGINLVAYNSTTNNYNIVVTIPIEFKQSLEIRAYNSDTVDHQASARVIYSKPV